MVAENPERAVVSEGAFLLMNEYADEPGRLVFLRHLEVGGAEWPVERYAEIRSFFEKVRETDREIVVMKGGSAL